MANRKLSLFLLLLFLSAVYIFIFSENGFLERINFNERKAGVLFRIETEKKINLQLKKELLKRNEKTAVEDLRKSGFIRDGDRVLVVKDAAETINKNHADKKSAQGFVLKLQYVRILWIVISLLILFLFFSAGKKSHGYN